MAMITVARDIGTFGDDISRDVALRLNAEWLDGDAVLNRFLAPIAQSRTLAMLKTSPKHFLRETTEGLTVKAYLEGCLSELATRQDTVLVGMSGVHFIAHDTDALHISLVADLETRITRTMAARQLNRAEATRLVATADRRRRRFSSIVFGMNDDATRYDAVFNTATLSRHEIVNTIVTLAQARRDAIALRHKHEDASTPHDTPYPILKNESERQFATLLDHYGVEWRYEPRTFPVAWDDEGRVSLAFSPDFYLPRFDLYLELTTMNQKYVSLKKKKLAKLRELYPGVRVKIVYGRDFHAMMERFNG